LLRELKLLGTSRDKEEQIQHKASKYTESPEKPSERGDYSDCGTFSDKNTYFGANSIIL
jgi:hypothetical protein